VAKSSRLLAGKTKSEKSEKEEYKAQRPPTFNLQLPASLESFHKYL